MDFDSTIYSEHDCHYGAVYAELGKVGSGNNKETVLVFETPSGFAQLMEVTILCGDNPHDETLHSLQNVHTICIKIIGEWEADGILTGLAELIGALKLKSILDN